jgi:tetratricopeptide (TPR) repeat protein
VAWKVDALHALGRHGDALRALSAIEIDPAAHSLVRLKAVLLCDVGDFAGAIDVLQTATESTASAPHVLLGLRGWAHQHLTGAEHAAQAERMYRGAHESAPDDLWYREGLAHALWHLPGREADAMDEYRAVVQSVEERMRREDVDAYTACLAGWCCYALNRLHDAANYYSAALTMSQIGPAAELDYALILLSLGCHADARSQYERILDNLGRTNPLRRGGLLYVALFDLRDAASRHQLDAFPETIEIRRALLRALTRATDEYRQPFPELAGSLRDYVERAERELAAARPAPPSGSQRLSRDEAGVEPLHRTPVAYVTPGDADCALLIAAPSPPSEGAAVPMALDRSAADGADRRALYLTEAFLESVGASRHDSPLDSLAWQKLDTPAAAWAAWTTEADGARILNSLAGRLVKRAATHLARHGHAGPDESHIPAARAADLAAKIARDEALVYQAALLRTVAGATPEHAEVPAPDSSTEPQELVRDAAGLRREASRRYTAVVTGHQDSAQAAGESEVHYTGRNDMVKSILSTAYRIAQIPDLNEQARRARTAAERVEALAPLHDLAAREREQVHQRLASHDRFYLESDASILVLARDPAFYSTNVLLNLTKPAVNCFAFATASRRLGAAPHQPPRGQVRLKP